GSSLGFLRISCRGLRLTAERLLRTMHSVREVAALRIQRGRMLLGWLIATASMTSGLSCGTRASAPSSTSPVSSTSPAGFAIEEATIDGIHAAIRSGQTTCKAVVQAYIDRARAYNGVCTSLVTADGADIPPATGPVRAGAPLTFPTKSTKASTVFPDLDQYRGNPLDFASLETTGLDTRIQPHAD